jgi:hypothetical protein
VKEHNSVTLRGRVNTKPALWESETCIGFILRVESEHGTDYTTPMVPVVLPLGRADDVRGLAQDDLVMIEGCLQSVGHSAQMPRGTLCVLAYGVTQIVATIGPRAEHAQQGA